jgi:hypothetical protein
MPYADVNSRVATRTDNTALRLVKLRPFESWGIIKFNFFVDGEDLDQNEYRFQMNWPELRNARN